MKPLLPKQNRLREMILANLPGSPLAGYVYLVAVRGMFGDEINRWNDAIAVVNGDRVRLFRCTTDPGRPRRVHDKGVAWLIPGRVYRFQRGDHRGYPALVQAEPFLVWRLPPGKTPGRVSFLVEDGPGSFAINIHAANPRIISEVNAWSEGCIAIRQQDGWPDFLRECHAGRIGRHPQNLFTLKLVQRRRRIRPVQRFNA